MAAVNQNGNAIRFASEELRADEGVCIAAVQNPRPRKSNATKTCAAILPLTTHNVQMLASMSSQKNLSAAGSEAASLKSSGAECSHGKRARQCAICTPCSCTKEKPEPQRKRKDLCAACNPCACTKDKPKAQRKRRDVCAACNPCARTQNLPPDQRTRKDKCQSCAKNDFKELHGVL